MKTSIRNQIVLFFLPIFLSITANSQLKITGEIRPRFEYRHGFQSLSDSAMRPGAFVDQRTRLNFEYKKDKIEFKVAMQDVRIWGNQSQLVNNEDFGVSVHEAFGIAHISNTWAIKFGRQELVYDDHRIFGNVDWAQQARSHDGIVFQYRKDKLKLDIGGAFNQDKPQNNTTSYSIAKSYKTMQYVWSNYKFSEALNASFLVLSLGQQANFTNTLGQPAYQDNYTLTAGTRIMYKKNKIKISSNLFYQMGSTNSWPAKNVNGYLVNLDFSYNVIEPLSINLGFEMTSGNSQTDTSANYIKTERGFNPYFGTNHKFNGVMDYFYVGNHIGSVGLSDAYLGFDYKKKTYSIELLAHFSNSSQRVKQNRICGHWNN